MGFRGVASFPYWVAQTLGAAAAASIVLYGMFFEAIIEFERQHGLLRGGPGSELSAMVFGEYFPNPAIFGTDEQAWRVVGPVYRVHGGAHRYRHACVSGVRGDQSQESRPPAVRRGRGDDRESESQPSSRSSRL